jgi:integrase
MAEFRQKFHIDCRPAATYNARKRRELVYWLVSGARPPEPLETPMKLTATRIKHLTTPGLYGDGGNLWLRVTETGSQSWVFRYSRHGRARVMGLGSLDLVPLGEARRRAVEARKLLLADTDPLEHREQERAAAQAAQARATTFAEAAEHYIAAHRGSWAPRYQQAWQHSLRDHALPLIGHLPVEQVDTDTVRRVLQPIWADKTPTASLVRGRLETILTYATVRGWRSGPNPAVWRGSIQVLLPARGKVHTEQHRSALDWREAPGFMAKLREQSHVGAAALQFTILTAARSGEVRGATWNEVDEATATWTVPAARMKADKAHRVPLSRPALALLERMQLLRRADGLIFPGLLPGTRISLTTPRLALQRMGRADLTVHGFRSTFRDWAAEATGHPNHVVEQALAHTIGSAVEAAYRRGDLFAKRVVLMNDWATYLERPAARVVDIASRRRSGEATAPRRAGRTSKPASAPGAA